MTLSHQFLAWDAFREREEGGYSDHASDTGGATKYGISKASHPEIDIANLTREQAQAIACHEYWNAVLGDEMPWPVNIVLADFAFHSGASRALKALAVEVGLDPEAYRLDDLGEKARELAAHVGPDQLAANVHLRRVDFLVDRCRSRADQLVFLKGWMRRTHRLSHLI